MANEYNINAILSITNRFTQPLQQFRQQISNIRSTMSQAQQQGSRMFTDTVNGVQVAIRRTENLRSDITRLAHEYRRAGLSASESMRRAHESLRRVNTTTQQTTQNANKMGNSMDKMASKLKTAIATLGIVKVGKDFFTSLYENSSNMEVARAKMETFTSSAQEAGQEIARAKEFANKTPFETGEVVDGMIKMKSYGLETSDAMMTSVGDMAGAMGKSFDQAVEAIADAQTGELERLKEFGITKQMIIDQGAKTMADKELVNSKGQIVDQENFNKALLQLMNDRFTGGMEKQANTVKGMISTFKGMKDNILSIIGGIDNEGQLIEGGFLSRIKNMVKSANDKILELTENGTIQRWADNFNNALSWLANKFEYYKNVLTTVFTYVKNVIVQNKDIIVPAIAGIVSAFVAFKAINSVIKMVTKVKGAITALKTAFAFLSSPIGIAVVAIGLLVAGFIYAYKHSEKFRNIVNGVVQAVKEKIISLKDKFGGCMQAIKTWLEEHQTLVDGVKLFIQTVIDFVVQCLGNMITNIGTILGGIIEVITGIIDIITGIFQGDWNKVWEGCKEVVKGAIDTITGWWNGLIGLFTQPIDFVVNLFKKDQSDSATLESAEVGHNAKGTNNWRGGLTWVNEDGGELMNLPNGTQIIPHDLSETMVKEQAQAKEGSSVIIPKLADQIVVREEADIDKIGQAIANKVALARLRLA